MRTGNIHDRLNASAALLALIDCRRRDLHSRFIGSNIERLVIERELRDLEEDLQRHIKYDSYDPSC